MSGDDECVRGVRWMSAGSNECVQIVIALRTHTRITDHQQLFVNELGGAGRGGAVELISAIALDFQNMIPQSSERDLYNHQTVVD